MNEFVALVLILLLALSGYAAGRVHGQFGYRMGYRYGYRQGYFDGDRASWNRRRRDLQAAVASVLHSPPETFQQPQTPIGTTYTSSTSDDSPEDASTDEAKGRHARPVPANL